MRQRRNATRGQRSSKVRLGGEEGTFQERVFKALRADTSLPDSEGGGGTAMVLCQQQLHQSSELLERGLALSCRREGRMAVALGICTAGEHAGRIQMTILSQAKMVITNLNDEADRFDATCVQAMMAHMAGIVSEEEQQRVRTLLEVKAQDSLITPSLPPGSSPIEKWVDFNDVVEAMETVG